MACRNLGQSAGLPAATSLPVATVLSFISVVQPICHNLPRCGRYALSSDAARGGMAESLREGAQVGARRNRRQNVMILGGVGQKRSTSVVLLANGVRCYLVTDECR